MKIRRGRRWRSLRSRGEQAPVEEPGPISRCKPVFASRATGTSTVRRGACAGGARTVIAAVTATGERGGRARHDRNSRSASCRNRKLEVADDRKSAAPSITDLLNEGQEIIVQIAKEPLGQKGARITSHIALPGRYVVYMPTVEHMGVSRKIASDEERQRLKNILQAAPAGHHRRLHRSHRGRRPHRRRDRRRHGVSVQSLA